MSSRQLRKLQKQKELEELQAGNPADESDDEPVQKPKASGFAGFAALKAYEDEDDDQDDDQGHQAVEGTDVTAAREEPEDPVGPPKASSKKGKKKRKKGKGGKKATEEKKTGSTPSDDDIDEIDRVLQELNVAKKGDPTGQANEADGPAIKAYERICDLLTINTQHLKVINEMRNYFGREAIASAQNEEQQEHERQERERRVRGRLRQNVDLETYLKALPGQSLPEVTLRRNPFLPGKETWPRASVEGLTMAQIPDATHVKPESIAHRAGAVEFSFVHDTTYASLEQQFFSLVQMYDPMQLVHFLHRHPYHVSTLIQVSKVAKQDQNLSLCGDLCERALFTFGRVSLSTFRQKLEQGKARLEFRRPENRQFWLAGYHYLKSLVVKGTYRTALEWAKLILSMDLSDPYGVIHFLHPLAIRAYESKWFIDFCDSEALDHCDTDQDYIRQTLVLARLQQKDVAGAKTLLKEGMERLPWLYSSLFQALGFDVPKAIWGFQPRNSHEHLWVTMFVTQTKSLWENSPAETLLREAANEISKPDYSTFAATPIVGLNLARFVYLDNTPSLMGLVPDSMLSASPNYEFDPLPPAMEDNIFSTESQKAPWIPDRIGREQVDIPMPQNRREFERFLDRVRHEGAPAEVQQILQDAIGQFPEDTDSDLGEGENGDEGGDRETAPGGDIATSENRPETTGLLQRIMNLVIGGPAAPIDDEDDVEETNPRNLPGTWVEESENSENET